jgi:hypothetical protein
MKGQSYKVDLTFFKVPHANFSAPIVDPTLDIHVGLTQVAITYPTRKEHPQTLVSRKCYHRHHELHHFFNVIITFTQDQMESRVMSMSAISCHTTSQKHSEDASLVDVTLNRVDAISK